MTRLVLAALLLAACTVPPTAVVPPPAGPTATASSAVVTRTDVAFDAARARAHLEFLAAPARGGRLTASPGYDEAARYLADQLRVAGVEPYGDNGTFFQRFTMPLVDLAATPSLETAAGARFVHRADFTETVGGTSAGGRADGPLVFAGNGSPEDLAATNVKDAVAILIGPGGDLAAVMREGAAGVLLVSDRMIKFSYIPRFESRTLPQLVVSEATADALLASSGKRIRDLARQVDERRRSGGGEALSFATTERVRMSLPLTPAREVTATNVVGIVRGMDPDLAKTAVLVGGHLDGVGTDPDGTVFQAANDNASGPAVLAEIARAVAARRGDLRRSVIFVAFAAEEQGLHGSEFFATRVSTIPGRAESLVAFLNLDVAGCCGSVLGISEDSPDLRRRVVAAAEAEGVLVTTFRGSSDHASFVRRRVASAQIGFGDTGPIHTPRDTPAIVTEMNLGMVGRVALRATLDLASAR
ncbi:MAG TPA: M28 family metallopeptidase [Candidatus Limnocylindria bacterium]|nr:M28 family metallopeptidase [Candidatus Limnocylindria bacterium]